MARLDGATLAVMAAAGPPTTAQRVRRRKKSRNKAGRPPCAWKKPPTFLRAAGERKHGLFLVGFAAETEHLEANARQESCKRRTAI